MSYSCIIVAAGSGARLALGYNKLLYKLKDDRTIIEHSVHLFQKDPRCKQIIIVCARVDMKKMQALFANSGILFVEGGSARQQSVYRGLQKVELPSVLIHDGARPYLKMESVNAVLECLVTYQACTLGVALKDSVKIVEDGCVKKSLDRSRLCCSQTPQAFKSALIKDCYEKANAAGFVANDDVQIVEAFSDEIIKIVTGDYGNIKITTKEDLP